METRKVYGCPKCGIFGCISVVRHCGRCGGVPFVLGDVVDFVRLNEATAKRIYGDPLPKES